MLVPTACLLFAATFAAAACSNITVTGCQALALVLPSKVFFPSSDAYKYEAGNFWSNTEILAPGCVFRPESATDVSTAILTLQSGKNESVFAVRGGGHMGIKGANNVDDGVLVVLSNLSSINLSDDHQSLTLASGWRWGDVFSWLEPHGLTVAGGRLSPVGVPGLLLAGGINFLGNQHGWAADNVLEYEVVLASGDIVVASSTENVDLFWALKGGSSNLGIVTQFKIRAFPSPGIWGGIYVADQHHTSDMLAAIANFAAFNTDPLTHLVAMTISTGIDTWSPAAVLFHDSPGDTNAVPDAFASFFEIPAASNSVIGNRSIASLAAEIAAGVADGHNDMFIAGTTVGRDYDSLLQGVRLTNNIFSANIPYLYDAIGANATNVIKSASINWQPIGDLWVAGSQASNPLGNALGIDLNKGTYLAWAETVEWYGSEYDEIVATWAKNTTDAINAAAKEAAIYDPFTYIGDASGFQLDQAFPGYGEENQAKLLAISRKYDPGRFFQTLLPGGFKIGL
ncbi:FAD binding domain-containing protein [Truncatella angustata]|uniref:FAD binding domain-containing protein n=1 Tax=Truncatella angustata TaxID=152316 RepID=A0A9P8USL5_9PEZI|nr:FAD binding domain-containing protein [Truncatella angustata]KAH6657459.1 FAD binding domain-containing protein [Truncatella angustata]KAH8199313.1 hypothetical protein TruAng_006498 [Truncatella angustata]